MKGFTATVFAVFLFVHTGKTHAAGDFHVYGVGAKTCGAWTEARAGRGEYAENDRHAFVSWTQGFITSASAYGMTLRHVDPEGISAYLDQYCAEHPVDEFLDASMSLVRTLRQ